MKRLAIVGALLAACAEPETIVRLRVEHEDAWALTALEVQVGERVERATAVRELLVHVPDAWAGEPVMLAVRGLRGDERWASGEVEVTPVVGAEVQATVVLARLPCGAWCTVGATQCEGDGVVVCEERDGDACLEWSTRIGCSADAPYCSLGVCRADCVDECAQNETRCAGPEGVQQCGEADDGDACLEWLPVVECASGETCSNGRCATTCTDECEASELACHGGGIVRCGDRNADGCREWGPIEPCAADQSCQAGACRPNDQCEDQCSATMCSGASLVQCGNYDLDPCLEPSPGTSCVPSDPCMEGRCTLEGCESTPRVCDTPPSPTCADADTLRTYGSAGSCTAGACRYPQTDTPCPRGCEGGACLGGCEGVVCNAPPNTCHEPSGTCTDGVCSYAPRSGGCDDGDPCTTDDTCSAGTCAGTPMTCSTPEPAFCLDANTLRTYASSGTCAAGACTYPPTDLTCELGCVEGVCHSGAEVVQIVAGFAHTCARHASGAVSCWGYNGHGTLGDGTTIDRHSPVRVIGLTDAVEITAGAFHTCARRTSGAVLCWGYNEYGQLGDGTTTGRHSPVTVIGLTDAIEIAAGIYHTCARRTSGRASCWGLNGSGQLGDGTTTSRFTPVSVTSLTYAVEIAVGGWHTCARRASGAASCWGFGGHGQLGTQSLLNEPTPAPVRRLADAIEIAAGYSHTCARGASGVSCWGENGRGQFGDGTTSSRAEPVPVTSLTTAVEIAAGRYHTCARQASGAVSCSGGNEFGQLGDDTTTDRLTPMPVTDLTDAIEIALGQNHACARRASGAVSCWGNNESGQLGDGTTTEQHTPVMVMGL